VAIIHNVEEMISDLPESVTMVAVVKYATDTEFKELVQTGIRDFGFNTFQHLEKTKELLPSDSKIHFIGHLQSNKIKKLLDIGPFLIQCVDSFELAEKINIVSGKSGICQDILLQVKTDSSKEYGILPDDLKKLSIKIDNELENIRIMGLMTIPKLHKHAELLRPTYKSMKFHYDSLSDLLGRELAYLSMGMSSDYRVAVQEGSNMVRIGRALFR
jgi:PLP dependent protein